MIVSKKLSQWSVVAAAVTVLSSLGCGGGSVTPELIPVMGKVTLEGQPVVEGAVSLRDASGQLQPAGLIAADGTYKIYLGKNEGAPAGEYRALVFVRQTPRNAAGEVTGLPKMIGNQKYASEHTTPLKITVKPDAAPGAYDLSLNR